LLGYADANPTYTFRLDNALGEIAGRGRSRWVKWTISAGRLRRFSLLAFLGFSTVGPLQKRAGELALKINPLRGRFPAEVIDMVK
jgi:hypothetical protein